MPNANASKDIFNRTAPNFGGVFSSDSTRFTFGGMGDDMQGLVIRNMRINYSQPVQRIHSIADTKVYYVQGRPMGKGSISSVVGPTANVCCFYKRFGDICKVENNNFDMTLSAEHCNAGGSIGDTVIAVKFVVITDVGLGVDSQDMLIASDTTFEFGSLECNSPGECSEGIGDIGGLIDYTGDFPTGGEGIV